MQRESTRALVLKPSGGKSGAHAPPGIRTVKITLDKAFDLIEGHPVFIDCSDFALLIQENPSSCHPPKAVGRPLENIVRNYSVVRVAVYNPAIPKLYACQPQDSYPVEYINSSICGGAGKLPTERGR